MYPFCGLDLVDKCRKIDIGSHKKVMIFLSMKVNISICRKKLK